MSARSTAIIVDAVIGLLLLPFNIAHLGESAYGLWLLSASVTAYFGVLDLGYGGALIRFIAQHRAQRNGQALNESASTLWFAFAGVGAMAFLGAIAVAVNVDVLFRLNPEQSRIATWVMILAAVPPALHFPFSVYGGVVAGFQRFHVNSVVAVCTSVAAAAANVAVLLAGYGLIHLVAVTTVVRVASLFAYRRNAHRVFPPLRIRPSLVRAHRLKALTAFSVYASMISWGTMLNYSLDALIIGATLGPAPVAVWAVAQRIVHGTQLLTNQLSAVLFPVVVDLDTLQQQARLQQVLVEGMRVSLAMVLPIATTLVTLGWPLIHAWVGHRSPTLMGSVIVLQILAVATVLRVGNATGTVILKGAGQHRFVAWTTILAGLCNVALSLLLVRRYGLAGVALGTLLAIGGSELCVLYPAACRRVGLRMGTVVARAVWPTLWPAVCVGALQLAARDAVGNTLGGVGVAWALGTLLYVALFFGVALSGGDRKLYGARLRAMRRRRAVPAPA